MAVNIQYALTLEGYFINDEGNQIYYGSEGAALFDSTNEIQNFLMESGSVGNYNVVLMAAKS